MTMPTMNAHNYVWAFVCIILCVHVYVYVCIIVYASVPDNHNC